MKNNSIKIFLLCTWSCFSIANAMAQSTTVQDDQTGTGESNGYHLVWQDLFDNGTLDETNNWNIEVNGDGGGNSELQYYRRENVTVGNEPDTGYGCLIITAKKESYNGKTCTSGRLTTQGKMSFKHGKLEARIKLPHTANGLWPAFWMLGNTINTEGWPRCGEVDIVEMGNSSAIKNGTQDKFFNGACHWGYYVGSSYPNYAKSTTNSYGLQDDFHLFTLTWDGDMINMYLDQDKYPDESPYYAMSISGTATDTDPGTYFHRPFFVLFNLAVGGNFPQIWNINNITALSNGDAKMYVDFVKVYQKGTSDEEFTGKTVTGIVSNKAASLFDYNSDTKIVSFKNEISRAILHSIDGKCILNLADLSSFSVADIPRGVYVVYYKMKDGTAYSHKIYIK